jgi:hypothetical protein
MMSAPAAWRAFASRMTSMTTKGSIALRKDGAKALADVSGGRFVIELSFERSFCMHRTAGTNSVPIFTCHSQGLLPDYRILQKSALWMR